MLWKTLPDPWEAVQAPVSGILVGDPYGGSLGILHDDGTNALLSSQEGGYPFTVFYARDGSREGGSAWRRC
jgi:hypothetical protein